ncbi:hypothetical protein ACWCPQ_22210 [Nocardia sp. NPDC001965]
MSQLGRELLQSMRDAMVRVLTHRAGPHLRHTLGDLAEEVREARRITGADHRGRDRVETGTPRSGRPMAHDGRNGNQDRLPDNMAGLLTRIHASGVDPETAARVERALLDRYQRRLEVEHRIERQNFLRNRSRDLRGRGETADAAETTARSQVDEYMRSERAQHMIDRAAGTHTTEWADRIDLTRALREVAISPRVVGVQSADRALRRLAARRRPNQLPKRLNQIVTRIETSGADPRAISDAMKLLREKLNGYRLQPMADFYHERLLEQRAEFTREGFPPRVADALAQQGTEALTGSAKAQRTIDGAAANTTHQWFTQTARTADHDGVGIVDRLAEIYRRPPSESDLRAAGERITAMRDNLDTTQRDLDRLLERSPELAEKGAERWQERLDAIRARVTRLADSAETGMVADRPIIRRDIDHGVLRQEEGKIRGSVGEIRMAEKLDDIHELGPVVDAGTPTGARIASEIDIVTDGGRVWHEVKNNDPAIQHKREEELEAQARKQLAISHMNREYWVDGKPPQLKIHFMEGVDPAVRSRIEAVRIQDENGRILDDHRVEVIDES